MEGRFRGGADAIAMAGGDGAQAVVAAISRPLGLPYACIPAGTRNHFALDLGVDRDDVVGALDAFVDGGERLVDLAEVNGRVFVNNVSLQQLRRRGSASGLPRRQAADDARGAASAAGPEGDTPRINWRDLHGFAHEGGLGVPRLPTTPTGSAARGLPARGLKWMAVGSESGDGVRSLAAPRGRSASGPPRRWG